MSSIPLVDTNVISELTRPRPNAGVLAWADTVSIIALSVVSLEELFYGLAWKSHPKVRAWLESFLSERCRLLPVSPEVASRAEQLRGHFMAHGSVRTQADVLIAATAQVHQVCLVTRNVRDFEGAAIALLNPFT